MRKAIPNTADRLFEAVYDELRGLAHAEMLRERGGATLQATALVHEAWLRLSRERHVDWASRAQFFAAAATAMRRILVEAARRRTRARHGGELRRIELDGADELGALDVKSDADCERLIVLDRSLARLERIHPDLFRVVELRYFAGLCVEEAARVLAISERSVVRDFEAARVWLFDDVRRGGAA